MTFGYKNCYIWLDRRSLAVIRWPADQDVQLSNCIRGVGEVVFYAMICRCVLQCFSFILSFLSIFALTIHSLIHSKGRNGQFRERSWSEWLIHLQEQNGFLRQGVMYGFPHGRQQMELTSLQCRMYKWKKWKTHILTIWAFMSIGNITEIMHICFNVSVGRARLYEFSFNQKVLSELAVLWQMIEMKWSVF